MNSRMLCGLLAGLLVFAAALAHADAKTIPLDAETAKALELFGPGVVGKALPAPPIEDLQAHLNLGHGDWHYKIVHGKKKDGQKVRTESYAKVSHPDGGEAWKRVIGDEYVEYLRIHPDGSFVKYAEDDTDVGYGTQIDPGILAPDGLKAGETHSIKSELRAFKMKDRDKVLYKGTSTTHLTYLGVYEVTTPAGTWPAALIKNELEVKIGPADVTDTTYCFYAEGVGKIAETELLNVSALLVYHSNTKIAKVLVDWPKK